MRLIMNNSNSTTRTVHKNWGTYKSIVMRDSIYRLLAWVGLHETDIFRTNTGKCNILAINAAARDFNTPIPFFYTDSSHVECQQSYQFNAQSLNLRRPCE